MSDSIKKVSKKKILFVQIDEEITGVFTKLEKLPYKEIYLVVPKRAVLLQSVVNLKILKQKLEEIEKSIAIITNDPNGMKLALQAELKVFDQWDLGNEISIEKEERDPNSALLKPIAATQNDVEENLPSRLPKRKASIFEVVRDMKHKDKGFSLRSYLVDIKKNRLEHQPIRLSPGKKKWLVTFLLASALVFFVVIYVALPGATIIIEPTADVVSKGVNVTLDPSPEDDGKSLTAYPIETEVEETVSHAATGIENRGANAAGYLTIFNVGNVEQPLIQQTRFQTQEGIVFRLQEDVVVPAGKLESPGKVEVYVVADTVDANGLAVGERGNIGPSDFFLPALLEENREKVYAQSSTAMSGGTSEIIARVTEEDLLAAQAQLETAIQEKVLANLRKEVLGLGNSKGLNLKLLEDASALQFGAVNATLPYELIGQEAETFEVTGTVSLSGVAYDSDALYEILKTQILAVETPGKQLISVDKDSISLSLWRLI
ncbi:hypothetical protein IPG41_06885 [Candidatus Peregrinibacteria bacterium]|nr:MAG: hypothetical protein IPG41_06885 [Candidatus Peregrinibacteria bacterium]